MQDKPLFHRCPECKGSGCAQSLHAPDESVFLFPRCEACKGKGRLDQRQYETYMRAQKA